MRVEQADEDGAFAERCDLVERGRPDLEDDVGAEGAGTVHHAGRTELIVGEVARASGPASL